MKVILNIVVPGNPVPQGQMIARLRRDGRPYLAPQVGKHWQEWRNKVTVAAQEALGEYKPNLKCAYGVLIRFIFPRPPSHLKKDGTLRKGYAEPHLNKPDVDNLVKAIHDSLTKAGVWGDDCEVTSLQATKEYESEDLEPGVHICVLDRELT